MEYLSPREKLRLVQIIRTVYTWEMGKFWLLLFLLCGAMRVLGSIGAGNSFALSLFHGAVFAFGVGLLFVIPFEIITRLQTLLLQRKIRCEEGKP